MAAQIQGNSGIIAEVGGATFKGLHAHLKPLEYGSLGHYRTAIKTTLNAVQAANSRLLELRNAGSNLIIPTMIQVSALPVGAIGNPYAIDLSLFKCTSFSAVDTTNAVTPAVSVMRTLGMTGAPGSAQVRSTSGHQAGMTGGTVTKDTNPLGILQAWMASVSAASMPTVKDFLAGLPIGGHPPVLANNEGFVIENVVAGSATQNQVQVLIEISWAEVTAY